MTFSRLVRMSPLWKGFRDAPPGGDLGRTQDMVERLYLSWSPPRGVSGYGVNILSLPVDTAVPVKQY